MAIYYMIIDDLGVECIDQVGEQEKHHLWDVDKTACLAERFPDAIYFEVTSKIERD